jgi:CheY-like chemotaxis protein
LTRQLVAFSQQQPTSCQTLNLAASVGHTIKVLRQILGEDVTLEPRLSPGPVWIQADPSLVEQLVLHLAVNARRALPNGGRLLVFVESATVDAGRPSNSNLVPEACARLRIEWAEHSLEELRSDLADAPTRSLTTTDSTEAGMDSLRDLVDQLGARIEVNAPQGPVNGLGVLFPVATAPGQTRSPAEKENAVPGGSERVLVVEDDPGLRKFMVLLLQRLGYKVAEAASGPDAITIWTEHNDGFDLLVTDVVMPSGLSGVDLAARLQKRQPDLPVLFISGHDNAKMHGLNSTGEERVLRKPFTPEALALAVRTSLDHLPARNEMVQG